MLEAARRHGSKAQVVHALRGVPPTTYRSLNEMLASVHTDDEPEEENARLKAQRQHWAQRRREHTKNRLAERAKDLRS